MTSASEQDTPPGSESSRVLGARRPRQSGACPTAIFCHARRRLSDPPKRASHTASAARRGEAERRQGVGKAAQPACQRRQSFVSRSVTTGVLTSGMEPAPRNGEASLFEVNIRYVGGLLAAYYLTGEEILL
ncbi:Mannosyl-oligosaccharide 1,2-alpha-mannosidase IC [Liparis tanakae]|uniref:Mannosyl-oligosaccharide 1,2-alpha-mannosidase IC n=1 Tax=Liparis tanakae TaxID=230148 RepID=A0A4Z2HQ30_9TELE|nr:Mannosyl-oligosaccharide 1,2-alpha-mannosidase IC [Liparis tanakae]